MKPPYLVLFSGGPDSIFLVETLLKVVPSSSIYLLYINHNLRSNKQLKKEINIITAYAKTKKCLLKIKSLPVKTCAKIWNLSIEGAGRECRYRYAEYLAKHWKCKTILTAHHLDDQLETYLMKKAKNIAVTALPIQTQITFYRIPIHRPLLSIPKFKILAFLNSNQIPYSTDETNKNLSFERNKTRVHTQHFLEENPHLIPELIRFFNSLDTPPPYQQKITLSRSELTPLLKTPSILTKQLSQFLHTNAKQLIQSSKHPFKTPPLRLSGNHIPLVIAALQTATNLKLDLPGPFILVLTDYLRVEYKPHRPGRTT